MRSSASAICRTNVGLVSPGREARPGTGAPRRGGERGERREGWWTSDRGGERRSDRGGTQVKAEAEDDSW